MRTLFTNIAAAEQAAKDWVEEFLDPEFEFHQINPVEREDGGMPIYSLAFKEDKGYYTYREGEGLQYFVAFSEGSRVVIVSQATKEGMKEIGKFSRIGKQGCSYR